MISDLLLVLGTGVFSAALRSFRHPVLFRVGTLGMVLTSFLAGWLIGGSLVVGFLFAAMWFLLPWLEILTRIRRLRLPLDRRLLPTPPPTRATFPMFPELTEEMEADGYAFVDDAAWSHEATRQFFRVFQNPDRRTVGAICFVEQNEFAFYYVAFSSRTADGRTYLTWNYPFSFGLRLPPAHRLNRVQGEESIEALLERHRRFLQSQGVATDDLRPLAPEDILPDMQQELRAQLDHNLACGLLVRDGPEMIRYSVRGMFFLWFQFLRDFVRLS